MKDANLPVGFITDARSRSPPSVFGRVEIPAPLGNELGIMVSLEHGISLRLQQTLAHREPRQRCLEGKSG